MDGLFQISPGASTAAAGVLFAEDFDAVNMFAPPPKPRPTCTAAELEAARTTAYAEGREIGLAEATTQHEIALADAARTLAGKLVALRHDAATTAEQAAMSLARLLLDSLAFLFPALCALHGETEAAAVVRAVLPGLGAEQALHLSANPRILPTLGAELARLDPTLAARSTLTPSEMLAPGDVTLAWQHGTATRNAATLWQALADALAPFGLTLPQSPELADAR